MRKIDLKDFNAPPNCLTNAGALRKIGRAFALKDGEKYNGHHYGDAALRDLLRAYSLGKVSLVEGDSPKCYYCESKLEKCGTLQVEHYRPKAKVEEADNAGVKHPGYFWLGLEWSNLLLACATCNGKEYKGNRFPIKGARSIPINPVVTPARAVLALSLDRTYVMSNRSPLSTEEPLLINPEIDDPSRHLSFFINGKFRHLDEKGKYSTEIYGLNRILLANARKEILMNYVNDIRGYIEVLSYDDDVDLVLFKRLVNWKFKEMVRAALDLSNEYIYWRSHIINDFRRCFLPLIPPNFRGDVVNEFDRVKVELWP